MTLVVTATTRSGAKLRTTRRYRTCVPAEDAVQRPDTLVLARA